MIHGEMSPVHKVLISSLTYMFCRRVKHILACRDTQRPTAVTNMCIRMYVYH